MSYFSIKIGHLVEKEIQQKIKLLSIENLKERKILLKSLMVNLSRRTNNG